jgi:hypothetical protein
LAVGGGGAELDEPVESELHAAKKQRAAGTARSLRAGMDAPHEKGKTSRTGPRAPAGRRNNKHLTYLTSGAERDAQPYRKDQRPDSAHRGKPACLTPANVPPEALAGKLDRLGRLPA